MKKYDAYINNKLVRQNLTWTETVLFGNDPSDPYSTTGKPIDFKETDSFVIFLHDTITRVDTNGNPKSFNKRINNIGVNMDTAKFKVS
jgi:hypothetical protein